MFEKMPTRFQGIATNRQTKMGNQMKKIAKYLLIVALPLAGNAVYAVTSTGVLPISATVIDSCIVAATPIAFGSYNSTSAAPLDISGTVTTLCSNGTSYGVSMNAGTGVGATLTTRKMTAISGTTLNYGTFTDAAHTSTWGDGTGGTATVTGIGTGLPQVANAYGRVFPGQTSSTGAYADTITVTVTY